MPFVSFSCLTAMAGTCSSKLNKSTERRHPCLVLILEGKYSVFHPKYDVRCGFFADTVYQVKEVSLYF